MNTLKDFWNIVEQYYSFKKQYKDERELGAISKCVNCGRYVGTLFTNNDRLLKAVCGDTKNPCNLNIQLKMPPISYITKDMREENKKMDFLKNKIIEIKNDYIFGYTTEEETAQIFKQIKDDLNATITRSQKMFQLLIDLKPNMEEIDKLKTDREELIVKYKVLMNDYKISRSATVLENAMVLCKEITSLGSDIMKMTYKRNSVEKGKDDFRLIQELPLEYVEIIDTTLVKDSDMKKYILNDKTRLEPNYAPKFEELSDDELEQVEELSVGKIDIIPDDLEDLAEDLEDLEED